MPMVCELPSERLAPIAVQSLCCAASNRDNYGVAPVARQCSALRIVCSLQSPCWPAPGSGRCTPWCSAASPQSPCPSAWLMQSELPLVTLCLLPMPYSPQLLLNGKDPKFLPNIYLL